MKKIGTAFAALVFSMSFSGLVHAFGAIAVDDSGDEEPGYGFVTGAETRQQAERGALKQCREHGNENCKIVVWFKKCGAYAESKKRYGYGYGDTKAAAINGAMEGCGNNRCKLIVAECE